MASRVTPAAQLEAVMPVHLSYIATYFWENLTSRSSPSNAIMTYLSPRSIREDRDGLLYSEINQRRPYPFQLI